MGDSSARQTTDHRLDSWKEIAAFFGRDERTVRRWEAAGKMPPRTKQGRRLTYRSDDIETMIAANAVEVSK